MRRLFALFAVAILAAPIMTHPVVAQTPAPDRAPTYDPASEQAVRLSCNRECFNATGHCRTDAASSACATFSITCFIGCRECVSTYQACRASKASDTPDECLRGELICVAQKRQSQDGRSDLIRFSGGDGTSIEAAVVIEGARNEAEGVVAESYWASRNRFGWHQGDQALMHVNSRHFDQITYSSPDGAKKDIIFYDITSFYGK